MQVEKPLVNFWPAAWRALPSRGDRQRIVKPGDDRYSTRLPMVLDTYHEPVEEDRVRARGCRCEVPCLTFVCFSSHHRGARATPWCRGCDDSDEVKHRLGQDAYSRMRDYEQDVGWCDDCWCKTMRGYIEKRVRDLKRHKNHTRLKFTDFNGKPIEVHSMKHYRELLWARGTWLPDKALEERRRCA